MTPPLTFMVETWADCRTEMAPLWFVHWQEIAIHRDVIALDPDLEQYAAMQAAGMLCLLIARCEGRMVGYYASIIKPHLHYRTVLHAFTDVYYLLPEFRKGRNGIRLIDAAKRVWRERGVKKAFTATKKHLNMGPVLLATGWEQTEDTYCILL